MFERNKKGFTLIELLATIVILAVIALIAIPQVLKTIENSKKESFRNSVSGIIRAVQQNYSDSLNYDLSGGLYYSVSDGELYLYSDTNNMIINIPYNGSLKNAEGKIIVTENEKIYATINNSKWCAIKKYDSSKVEVYTYGDENCHDELLNPTLSLYAKNVETNEEYISGEWTSENIILIALTDSIDTSNYEFKWYRNGKEISNINSFTYEVTNQQENALYKYSVMTSEGEIFYSNEILVKIDKFAPSCNIMLDGTVTSEEWYLDDVTIKLDKSSSYSDITNYGLSINGQSEYNNIDELVITDNGIYEIYGIVENELGKSATCYKSVNKDDVTNFTVNINATLEGTDTPYISETISTSNVILTGLINPTENISGYKYSWYKDGNIIEDENSLTYKVVESGTYYLQVKSGNGNIVKSNVLKVVIDTSRPTCSLNVTSGTLGSNGWYTSDVVVGLTKTDATKYDITTSSLVSYNNETSVTLSSSSNVYCYVASEVSTNSNSKTINIDKTAPTISSLSGTSVSLSGYKTKELKLTAVASDTESGILRYEFYKISQIYDEETLMGSNTTGIYTVTNPPEKYNYKVKIYNNAGLSSEKTLTESCDVSKSGSCYNGYKTIIYTCTTGRQYSATTSLGCTITTTTTSGSSSGSSGSSSGGSSSTQNACDTGGDTGCSTTPHSLSFECIKPCCVTNANKKYTATGTITYSVASNCCRTLASPCNATCDCS